MAAFPETQWPELLDLVQVRVQDLEPLLQEEIRTWRERLDWDFSGSAELVRRFVEVQALRGHALRLDGDVVGYSYYVAEDHKGLIGDLFIKKQYRTPDNEYRLLAATLDGLMRTRHVRRIESQLMLLEPGRRPLPGSRFLRIYERNFMVVDLNRTQALQAKVLAGSIALDQWSERRQEETAHLIASAYRNHIDSEINDQYRSVAGARRFLFNIVQYPGCGIFYLPASWLALHRDTNRLCGVSLTSLVAANAGHVTQICVSPGVKGTGVGYELLRHSLVSLVQSGAQKVSLTVTAANREAVRLYERVGFRTALQFPALVWDGF